MRRRGPTDAQLQRLQTLRLQAGLSLDSVAERTGLPVAHVEALEQARIDELPAGPYVGAYYRLVLGVVGGGREVDDGEMPDPPAPSRVPLWAARLMAFASVLLLLGVAALQLQRVGLTEAVSAAEGMVGSAPSTGVDQTVRISPRRRAAFRVEVDGDVVLDRLLDEGASQVFQARDRIVVDLDRADDAYIEYNGERIIPLGRQGKPRRLVFLDDPSDL